MDVDRSVISRRLTSLAIFAVAVINPHYLAARSAGPAGILQGREASGGVWRHLCGRRTTVESSLAAARRETHRDVVGGRWFAELVAGV